MGEKKFQERRRQHYVWQYHLKHWAKDGKRVFSNIKNQNKIVQNNTKDVCVKAFIYEIKEISDKEYKVLELIVLGQNNDECKKIIREFISPFINVNKAINYNSEKFTDFEEAKKLVNRNGMEYFHSHLENEFVKIYQSLKSKDLSFINDEEIMPFFHLFLTIQYLRTKRMYDVCNNIYQNAKEKFDIPQGVRKLLTPEVIPIIQIMYAILISYSIFIKKDFKICILVNNTEINFITSDQPVINYLESPDERDPKDFGFYMPLTPRLAITFSNKTIEHKITEISDSEIIKNYNEQIRSWSDNFLIAVNEDELS